MSPVRGLLALCTGLLACSFDPRGPAAGSGGDGGPDDAGNPSCPDPFHAEIAVNGASFGTPYVSILVGDSVRLSAEGSCTRAGPVELTWAIEDDGGDDAITATASGPLSDEVLDLYPLTPGDYTVSLTVGDGTGAGDQVSVFGFRATGWQVSTEALDIRDLAIGDDLVWIAANEGAYQLARDSLLAAPELVNDLADGDDLANDLVAAYSTGPSVWFAQRSSGALVWRLDLDPAPVVTAIDFTGDFEEAAVNDIGRGDAGVVLATRDGVVAAPDDQTFGPEILDTDASAVTYGGSGGWIGGDQLYRLTDQVSFDVFGAADNKIRSLLEVDGEVWAGSDGLGVAVFDSATEEVVDVFTVEAGGLSNNRARDIAVDTGGDLWVATARGVARYKRDREVWVAMGTAAGLDNLDLHAIGTFGNGSGRSVVVGSREGIAILRLAPD
jgi:hypothetical protein